MITLESKSVLIPNGSGTCQFLYGFAWDAEKGELWIEQTVRSKDETGQCTGTNRRLYKVRRCEVALVEGRSHIAGLILDTYDEGPQHSEWWVPSWYLGRIRVNGPLDDLPLLAEKAWKEPSLEAVSRIFKAVDEAWHESRIRLATYHPDGTVDRTSFSVSD